MELNSIYVLQNGTYHMVYVHMVTIRQQEVELKFGIWQTSENGSSAEGELGAEWSIAERFTGWIIAKGIRGKQQCIAYLKQHGSKILQAISSPEGMDAQGRLWAHTVQQAERAYQLMREKERCRQTS